MPSLKMKTKLSVGSLREKSCLSVCPKSSMISKVTSSNLTVSRKTSEFDECVQKCQEGKEIYSPVINSNEAVYHQEYLSTDNSQYQKQFILDSSTMGRMESTAACLSNFETIFSPALEPLESLVLPNINYDSASINELSLPRSGIDNGDDNRSSYDYHTCNVSDFFISDMIITSIPFDGTDDMNEINPFPDYKCAESNLLFDGAEQCMLLPFLEDTVKMSHSSDLKSCEEGVLDPDSTSLYFAINQIKSCNQESDLKADLDQADDFDPQLFIKNLPELSDVESNCDPNMPPKESWRSKSITLVLDLDETLVHSTLEYCEDADFTFTVFFNLKEHTVYVKQRPHLHTFLERVAEMFEVVIFTASQSIYAAQLLDILDPDQKLISRRVYRESCIFTDGSYTKDLTVLGLDLAKVAIIDNSPQVFRLQVNNGIPIKSWFSDPSDCALISLLPFLETLVNADDVRPIIAKTFGNKE
ncbi:SCP1-like small phosphatase 4 [Euphorbia peplus]|nr:SCP1-like small phosphatase 4 [Euphorbia peplus]